MVLLVAPTQRFQCNANRSFPDISAKSRTTFVNSTMRFSRNKNFVCITISHVISLVMEAAVALLFLVFFKQFGGCGKSPYVITKLKLRQRFQ
jgi:hypothetical protein